MVNYRYGTGMLVKTLRLRFQHQNLGSGGPRNFDKAAGFESGYVSCWVIDNLVKPETAYQGPTLAEIHKRWATVYALLFFISQLDGTNVKVAGVMTGVLVSQID